jgi:hypothetical protein
MTDIPNWLQAVLATLSLVTAATACLSASKSAKAAGAMLSIERSRRRDELDPIKNISIRFERIYDSYPSEMFETFLAIMAVYKYNISFISFVSGDNTDEYNDNFEYTTPVVEIKKRISQTLHTPTTISMTFRYEQFEWSYSFAVDTQKQYGELSIIAHLPHSSMVTVARN